VAPDEPENRLETLEDKLRVESLITAVLNDDGFAQAVSVNGLSAEGERCLRAGASIVAGLFVALASAKGIPASKLWSVHMQHTTESRERRGLE